MGVRHQAKEAESAKKGKAVQRLEESKEMKLSVRPSETRLKRRGKGLELSSGLYMFVSIVRRPCVAMAALVCAKLNENERGPERGEAHHINSRNHIGIKDDSSPNASPEAEAARSESLAGCLAVAHAMGWIRGHPAVCCQRSARSVRRRDVSGP